MKRITSIILWITYLMTEKAQAIFGINALGDKITALSDQVNTMQSLVTMDTPSGWTVALPWIITIGIILFFIGTGLGSGTRKRIMQPGTNPIKERSGYAPVQGHHHKNDPGHTTRTGS